MPRGPDIRKITKLWKELIHASIRARPPDYKALYSDCEYSRLGAYIYGQQSESLTGGDEQQALEAAQAEINFGNRKNARHWVCSRNMIKPVEEPPKDIPKIRWKEPPIPWTGYYIDTDSIRAGCNPVTGRPYLFYRMVKPPPDFVCYDESGKRMEGAPAVKYFRRKNKEWIFNNWVDLSPEGEIIFKKRE